MALLNSSIKKQVQAALDARMKDPVRLVLFTQGDASLTTAAGGFAIECEFCGQTRELLEEVASLSPKVSLDVRDLLADADTAARYGVDKIPAVAVLSADGRDPGIRFYGIPSGYEFGALIEDILMVSTGELDLSAETLAQLARLDKPVHIQVYTTPT